MFGKFGVESNMRAKYCMDCGEVIQASKTECTECNSTRLHEVRSLVEGLYSKIEKLHGKTKIIRKDVSNF